MAVLEDTNDDDVPDTLMGGVYSVSFTSIDGSKPWKRLQLPEPVLLLGNVAHGFVYTLVGPISDNLRVANSRSGGYDGGKAINTEYVVGGFPNPLPPSLNSARDIAFTVQQVSAARLYADWTAEFDLTGEDGHADNPDGDLLGNLAEYGHGGAPDNPSDAPGVVPIFKNMKYVYRRRTDAEARGLSYILEESDNLVSNAWSSFSGSVSGITPDGPGFETVSNSVPDSATNLFLRLRVEM